MAEIAKVERSLQKDSWADKHGAEQHGRRHQMLIGEKKFKGTMTRQQTVQLQVRPVATNYATGRREEQGAINLEAAPTDTLRDIEEALVREGYVPSPPPGQGFKWIVVTASGEETPVSNTATIRQIVDMYQPRELKLLFNAEWG